MLRLKLVIVTYKRPKLLTNCLDSIPQYIVNRIDLSIAINGEDRETEDLLRHRKHSYRVIKKTTPSHARNILIEQDDGLYDYIGFADDDIIFGEHYFKNLIPLLETRTWDVLGGPDCTYPNSSHLESAIGLALTSPLATGPSRRRHITTGKDSLHECDEKSLSLFSLWISGRLFHLGYGFHPEYFRNEENILLYELSLKNYRFGFSSKLYVFHKRKDNLQDLCSTVISSGYHRMRSFFDYPNSSSFLYFLPGCFVLYLISLLFFHHIFLVSVLGIYLLINCFFALKIALYSRCTKLFGHIVLVQFLMNVAYGIGLFKLVFKDNKKLK